MKMAEKSKQVVLRNVALALGNDLRTVIAPVLATAAVASVAHDYVKEYVGGGWYTLAYALAAFVLGIVVAWLLGPLNGRLILRAIERDYGPKTRAHVFKLLNDARPGVPISIDLPSIARSNGEPLSRT